MGQATRNFPPSRIALCLGKVSDIVKHDHEAGFASR